MNSLLSYKLILTAFCAIVCVGRAEIETLADAAQSPSVQLENLVVTSSPTRRFVGPTPDVAPAGFASEEPPLTIPYPGSAYTAGISEGAAMVGVTLNASGHPTDVFLIACTQPYFGEALLHKAQTSAFVPAFARGVAVPSRFIISYNFYPDPAVPVIMNASEALMRKLERFSGQADFIYAACEQRDLDEPLELISGAVPVLPASYLARVHEVVRVPVSFYVDERGDLRLPNVDATPSPFLVRHAIAALQQWKFKPPTSKGVPAHVFHRCVLSFQPVQS